MWCSSAPASDKDVIQSFIDGVLVDHDFNGIVQISRNNEIIYSKTKGFSNIEKRHPLHPTTQFVIGSISKQITAVLVLKEFEKDTLRLNDPISRHLPYLSQDWAKKITIHQLLTHTHGIAELDVPLIFSPGSRFEYSQLGYELLAKILESVNGKSFADISQAFFDLHGLSNTIHPSYQNDNDMAVPYIIDESDKPIITPHSLYNYPAAGSFISTAQDLLKWNRLLHKGKLIQNSSYELLKTPYATRQHPIFGSIEYGYGVLFKKGEANIEIGTLGYAPGFVAALYYYPKYKLHLVVLENVARRQSTFSETFKVHVDFMQALKKISINEYLSNQ
jgi:CubicO group peptidase (beta-lactamase class C family)